MPLQRPLLLRAPEQIAIGPPPEQRPPPPAFVLGSVVVDVTALAERNEVGVGIVRGVVVAMRGGQNHLRPT